MILVISGANQLQQSITQCLSKHCFLYDVVSNFDSAESLLSMQRYSLIIDQSKGQASCIERIALLLQRNPDVWIMALDSVCKDAQSAEVDDVDYYDAGVDDYLVGPFNERVFIARIKAHMRRCMPTLNASRMQGNEEQRIEAGPFSVDLCYHRATLNGQTLELTAREFSLIEYFCRHPNQVFSRIQLLSEVWGYNHEGYEHTVNSHINRLRAKLDNISSFKNGGQLVQTVWGVGYKLDVTGHVTSALSA
ncbi:MAG: response regulator transcription factor [Pseudomonadota bacterium]